MSPKKVTSSNLTPPPEGADTELVVAFATARSRLREAEVAEREAVNKRAAATARVERYENLLLEHSGQGTLPI